MYIECIGTEFGTLQIRQHIRCVEISDVEITSVDCIHEYLICSHIRCSPWLPFFFGVLWPSSLDDVFSLFSLDESSPPESLLDWVLLD